MQQSLPVQPLSHVHVPGDVHSVQWLHESEHTAVEKEERVI